MNRETTTVTTADVLAWVVGPGIHLTDRNFAELYSVDFDPLRDLLTRLEAEGVVWVAAKHAETGATPAEQAWTWAGPPNVYRIQPGVEPGPRAASYDQVVARAKARGFDLDEKLPAEIHCHTCKAQFGTRQWTGERHVWSQPEYPAHVQTLKRLGRDVVAVKHTCWNCRPDRKATGSAAAPA